MMNCNVCFIQLESRVIAYITDKRVIRKQRMACMYSNRRDREIMSERDWEYKQS